MRIALLSTCAVAVPPVAYGGTELVIAELARGLEALGHDVTVYATGDSSPAGQLRYRFRRPVWPPDDLAELRHAAFAWHHVATHDPPFDLVHVHQAPAAAFSAMHDVPVALTLHHARDESLVDYYLDFPDVHYVAISSRQAELVPELQFAQVIHHGLDPARYPAGRGDGGHCAYLGRLSAEKGPHEAIEAAVAAGVPLRMGGAPHWSDGAYFEGEIRPRLARDPVTWLGELGHDGKLELLRGARALLFPIAWEEPFGLAMIEAMLVGTPVLAFPRGSVPEIVEEGITGFVVRDRAEMTERLRAIGDFDRERCRARAIERWSTSRMARDHAELYERMRAAHDARKRRLDRGLRLRTWGPGTGTAEGVPRVSFLPEVVVEARTRDGERTSLVYERTTLVD